MFAFLKLPYMYARLNLIDTFITSQEHGKSHDEVIHCISGIPTVWEKGQMYFENCL